MKIHHRAIGSTANDLLREDLSPISRLRDNRCFIKYATIRDSWTVINKEIKLGKSRGGCFHAQGIAPPSRADRPTETPFFAARIARYISTGSSGLFTDLFAPAGWALLATHPPEIKWTGISTAMRRLNSFISRRTRPLASGVLWITPITPSNGPPRIWTSWPIFKSKWAGIIPSRSACLIRFSAISSCRGIGLSPKFTKDLTPGAQRTWS